MSAKGSTAGVSLEHGASRVKQGQALGEPVPDDASAMTR